MFKKLIKKVKARLPQIGTAAAVVASSSVTAFASGGTTTGAGLDEVVAQTSTVASLVTSVWAIMTANPILLVMLAVSLLSVGFAVFRKAKRAVR